MPRYTVKINDAEEKALLVIMISIQDWIDNAIHNRARKAIDVIVETTTNKRARTLSVKKKQTIVLNATVETAAEKEARLLVELGV